MVLKNNKKGMFFTLLAIAILSLFLASYTIYSVAEGRKAVNKRVETMNSFIFSLEEDLPRQIYISGFRMIFLFEKSIIGAGSYPTNLNRSFQEAFFNGTIFGKEEELMNGVRFSDIQNSINEKASKINVNVSILNPSISVLQDDPWHVKIVLDSQLIVEDKSHIAQWSKNNSVIAYISVENFEDPLYAVGTSGALTNHINKTPYLLFVSGNDISNLSEHTKNSFFTASPLAPSFLDRLEGKSSANINGIESLVYLPKLFAQGIEIKQKSVVDYIYFSLLNPSSYNIQGMPSWFKLDSEHLSVYNASHLTS
ncbi:MAG: hypothetical protein NT076_02965 [Candidatus Pacearchaeota archaeon]|nr:hypothetical protein [Candidatus Pacearchaeota archaeon]